MLYFHLEWIDEIYSKSHKPIHSRPLSAILLLIDENILKLKNIDTENLHESQGFIILMKMVQEWYYHRYGELAKSTNKFDLKGIVLFHKNPLLINFPQTTTMIEVEEESSWMVYSTHIEEYEDIEEHFSTKIDLNSLNKSQSNLFYRAIDKIVYLTRKISINIFSDTSRLDDDESMMLKSIMRHIEKGIDDTLRFDVESSVACWEFHLAIEKSFKVYIKQKSGKKVFGHNLTELNEVSSKYNKEIDLNLLNELPTDKEAIKLRYAEMQLSTNQIISIYALTLEIVNDITKDLDRTIKIYNARILLKMAGRAW